jgi:hypothetical protein
MNAITIDIDWAPKPVIEDTLSLLNERDVEATVFSTHDDGIQLCKHERAIHPNFSDSESYTEALNTLLSLYPEAVGARSHQLHTTTQLKMDYPTDIRYESNYMMFGVEEIRPFMHLEDIVQFPIYFMDDVWLRHRKPSMDFESELDKDSLSVFAFHPIHIYLNTPRIEYYEQHKDIYHEPDALREERSDEFGVRDLFTSLLDTIVFENLSVATLETIRTSIAESAQQPVVSSD